MQTALPSSPISQASIAYEEMYINLALDWCGSRSTNENAIEPFRPYMYDIPTPSSVSQSLYLTDIGTLHKTYCDCDKIENDIYWTGYFFNTWEFHTLDDADCDYDPLVTNLILGVTQCKCTDLAAGRTGPSTAMAIESIRETSTDFGFTIGHELGHQLGLSHGTQPGVGSCGSSLGITMFASMGIMNPATGSTMNTFTPYHQNMVRSLFKAPK
jgi:hypothetical protein